MLNERKLRAVYFYQYLPPWRIDVFNKIAQYYDLTLVFTNAETEGFTYDRALLLAQLRNINVIFLNKGFSIASRPIRFGVLKIIREIKPDIIFSHEYSPTSIIVASYKRIGGYKYVITTSDNLGMASAVHGLKSICRKYVLNHSDGLVVYSETVKLWYGHHFPWLHINVCPNIQNPLTLLENRKRFPPIIRKYKRMFGIKDNDKVVLYIGRLVKVKGLDLLLNAFAHCNVDYKLIIVGSGNEEHNLKSLVRQLNLSDRVIFAGYYSGAELYAWYDMANYFILPSRYEPFGAVVNESLVFGCPVVVSKYIGALDFVNEKNGVIFDPLDLSNFIEILQQACRQFSEKPMVKVNLMPCSFDKYVSAFLPNNLN